jgi:hypothetical protein
VCVESSGFSSASYFAAPDGGRHGSSRSRRDSHGDVALQVMSSAPRGLIAIVFTDVQRAAALWYLTFDHHLASLNLAPNELAHTAVPLRDFSPAAMRDATLLHNDFIRRSMVNYGGALHTAWRRWCDARDVSQGA